MNQKTSLWSWLVAIVIMYLLLNFVINIFFAKNPNDKVHNIIFSDFLASVEKGEVAEVTMEGDHKISGKFKKKEKEESESSFLTYAPNDPDLTKTLRAKGVKIAAKPEAGPSWFMTLLVNWFPMLLLVGVWIFFMKSMQIGGKGAMQFGKSKAKLLQENGAQVTFEDVAGVEEAKEELEEVIQFLKDPHKFTKLGGRIPKGCLLIGPPGTGKTLLARAVAGEAGVPFFSIAGSDFVEMFVGVGASRVRDLFVQGKQQAPCIIFIDELDAVGRHRGTGLGGGHDEREQTLNQLLVEMDGFETSIGVIIMAATNRPDVLDPALLRAGRFDRRVIVPRPDVKGREAILKVHTRKVPLAKDADLALVAKSTPGFAGADLENLVNEAALFAAKNDKKEVSKQDFELAADKVLMGSERKSLVMSPKEKRTTAYHEAGHTLVAKSLPGADPVHKVTIIPRGMSLGVTQSLPEEDRHNYTKSYLEVQLAVLMGGRIAEETAICDISTGAKNDIEKATELAKSMVKEWGMSEKMGPLKWGTAYENPFLGKQLTELDKNYSEKTAQEIDEETRRLVIEAYDKAKTIVTTKRDALERLANALLEKEVLEGTEIDDVIKG